MTGSQKDYCLLTFTTPCRFRASTTGLGQACSNKSKSSPETFRHADADIVAAGTQHCAEFEVAPGDLVRHALRHAMEADRQLSSTVGRSAQPVQEA
ncbi:hypothetical protein [Persicitalea sp.]|uniref:hypothetical protein n=1 Tax=Persicitalea sp. TaxID=3100273 RepID=UPI003593C6A4